MTQCGNLSYTIRRTEKDNPDKPDIVIDKGDINQDTAITILGKRRREYGEKFNENILHLLENFSCPASNPNDQIFEQVPDTSATNNPTAFESPLEGQLWNNKSINRIYYWGQINSQYRWVPLGQINDIAGNSGQLQDGEALPKPVSQISGEDFNYDECSWNVSPAFYPDDIDYMVCRTTEDGNDIKLEMKYRLPGSSEMISGIANYQIIGVKEYSPEVQIEEPTSP